MMKLNWGVIGFLGTAILILGFKFFNQLYDLNNEKLNTTLLMSENRMLKDEVAELTIKIPRHSYEDGVRDAQIKSLQSGYADGYAAAMKQYKNSNYEHGYHNALSQFGEIWKENPEANIKVKAESIK